jgi:hypothetical protein
VSGESPTDLAVEYLLAIRHDDEPAIANAEVSLANLTHDGLRDGLRDGLVRKAFWIDLYNGAVLRQDDIRLDTRRQRLVFLRRPVITVAGRPLSLDRMDHGILRRSRWKLGLGFARNPLPGAFERAQRVKHLDPRVHFALNCAAVSCPPIVAYEADRIDDQLDLATRS